MEVNSILPRSSTSGEEDEEDDEGEADEEGVEEDTLESEESSDEADPLEEMELATVEELLEAETGLQEATRAKRTGTRIEDLFNIRLSPII